MAAGGTGRPRLVDAQVAQPVDEDVGEQGDDEGVLSAPSDTGQDLAQSPI